MVFPCGTEIANEIINSLKNHKYFKVKYASSEEMSYCNFRDGTIHILPYVSDKSFLDELNRLISLEQIDFIIPAHDDVAYELSLIESSIKANVIGQNKEINQIVRFKDVTYTYFKDLIPLAKYNIEIRNENDFPVFVKPKRGQGSQDSFKIKSNNEYETFIQKYDVNNFVVMEYLSGDEFTIDCFSHNGDLLYFGARTREKTTRGISILSTFVSEDNLNSEFLNYATIISRNLNMHGIWFFQMKFDNNKKLKLLEIGPRVSGTMMLNRARGINFVELALYQKLGFNVEIIFNNINISLARALVPRYKHNLKFENLYIDFDDTLFLEEKYINSDIMKLIFQMKNENKKINLITKNKKNNLYKTLHNFGIENIFDKIIHISEQDKKFNYIEKNSLLIDDSFQERKEAIQNGIHAIGIDIISICFKD